MVIVLDSPNMKRVMLDNGDTLSAVLQYNVWKVHKSYAGNGVDLNLFDIAIIKRTFDLGGYPIVEA